jgi:hypothetical protein
MDLSRGLMAARTLRLNGRTLHRTVGAEHATVTRVPALSLGHNKTSALHQAGPGYRIRACAETRVLAAHKLAMIDEKLAELGAMRKGLAALVAKCDSGANRSCPIIKVLVDD